MEDSRMNDIMCMALETAKTGKWVNGSKFANDEEIEVYVASVLEMQSTKGDKKKRVWMPE